MLKRLALHLSSIKDRFYSVSAATGATRIDSWIDIEGGIGNLFTNASLRRKFPDLPFYVDGETVGLSKNGSFIGHHIMVPKRGVAVHINAFNFPIWGMLEKVAVNWLAGMPAVVKPSEYTSYLTEEMVRAIIESGILPEGALQLVNGCGHGILDAVAHQDVVTFTGSAATGRKLKAHPRLLEESVPFNMEADSLNACVLGEDAVPGTADFDLFSGKSLRVDWAVNAMLDAYWFCIAVDEVRTALVGRLKKTSIGDPSVRTFMGALATDTSATRA